jgi:hypothetical protein
MAESTAGTLRQDLAQVLAAGESNVVAAKHVGGCHRVDCGEEHGLEELHRGWKIRKCDRA